MGKTLYLSAIQESMEILTVLAALASPRGQTEKYWKKLFKVFRLMDFGQKFQE